MHATRFARLSLVASVATAFTFTSIAAPVPGRAASTTGPVNASSAPLPSQAIKESAAASMVTTLREIGRVRATTTFCSTFRHGSERAASAAVAFEVAALATMTDLVRFSNPANDLIKTRLERALDDDLRNLTDLSRVGDSELVQLQTLTSDSTPQESKELLGVHDSLDRAKARQFMMVKDIAGMVGELAERAVPSSIDRDPADLVNLLASTPYARIKESGAKIVGVNGNMYGEGVDTTPSDLLGGGDYGSILDAGDHISALLPGDGAVRDELAAAALHAKNALVLGDCANANNIDSSSAPLPPIQSVAPAIR